VFWGQPEEPAFAASEGQRGTVVAQRARTCSGVLAIPRDSPDTPSRGYDVGCSLAFGELGAYVGSVLVGPGRFDQLRSMIVVLLLPVLVMWPPCGGVPLEYPDRTRPTKPITHAARPVVASLTLRRAGSAHASGLPDRPTQRAERSIGSRWSQPARSASIGANAPALAIRVVR
jgi:hypothetical protein